MSLDVLRARARAAVAEASAWAKRTVTEALRPLPLVSGLVEDVFRTREELVAENLLLRQQLIVASRKVKQPKFRSWERGLSVVLASRLRRWRGATLLVKPDTILRWHREGFRLLWSRKSKAGRAPKLRLPQETIDLIVRMSKENRLWGAERIRGELLKVGIRVGKRTVQRYMYRDRSSGPRDGQSWKTFLKNDTVWACDYLQLYDIWFRPIFAFFIVDVNAKHAVHVGVTRSPTEQWTAQQLREVTSFGKGPQVLIRDRDTKYGILLDRVAEGADIEVVLTAPCAPRMNSVAERFLRSVRQECTDHVIVLGEQHLKSLLNEYTHVYFNGERPHQGIHQRIPTREASSSSNPTGNVVAFPVLNGLHHCYRRVA
ncbi:integrase core domain-containing protein [Myxococcota bacterium]